MSYAYLFKYIIIGDTGKSDTPSLLPNSHETDQQNYFAQSLITMPSWPKSDLLNQTCFI